MSSEIVLEHDVLTALREGGLETPRFTVLKRPEEASDVPFDPPYTVKLLHPGVTHRARVGAIYTAVPSKKRLERRVAELLERWSDAVGVIVQEHLNVVEGIEAFLGIKEDDTFGTVVLLGLGGKLVEELRAYIVRRPPVDGEDVERSLRRVPGGERLLSEIGPNRLAEVVNTAHEVYKGKGWSELDVNPLLLIDGEAIALDGLAKKAD
ncbi:acetate--CoA ligase family protein [Methanopyrus sp. SNP6]|uniref:acetate--CoA ligase family protein n=1 Tax=Methanopyrus sp. SNP6 TaxID=1937005 RepID=UPI0011E594D9|nr:acetate--CoA ligase family protein [Methanopyrus sp. SNP6]